MVVSVSSIELRCNEDVDVVSSQCVTVITHHASQTILSFWNADQCNVWTLHSRKKKIIDNFFF